MLWNAVTGKTIGQPLVPDSATKQSGTVFSADGELLATAAEDGTVRVWKVNDGQLLWRKRAISGQIEHLQFSPDGSTLAVAHARLELCALEARTGKLVGEPIGMTARLKAAEWLASPSTLLLVDQNGVARLWNLTCSVPAAMLPVDGANHQAAVSSNGRVLAASESTNRVCILQSPINERFDPSAARFIEIGDFTIHALALSDDGSRIAVSAERKVFVFDTASCKQLCEALPHDSNVVQMQFTPDGARLACASTAGRASAWEVATGTKLGDTLDVGSVPFDIDIDPQGEQCAVTSKNGVSLCEIATGKRCRPGFLGDKMPLSARFLGDQVHLLVALPAGRLTQVWDTDRGQPIFALSSPSLLQCVSISADRRKFMTGDRDGTARLWSAQDAAPISPPFEHRSPLRVAIIDATGRFVLTITEDLKASLWKADTAELLAAVPLGRLLLQSGLSDLAPTNLYAIKPLAFFAGDGSKAYVLTQGCLLVTLSLIQDSRSATQIAADVAIRSGCELDSAGGLRRLTPEQLVTTWTMIDGSETPQSRKPSQLPARRMGPISQDARKKAH